MRMRLSFSGFRGLRRLIGYSFPRCLSPESFLLCQTKPSVTLKFLSTASGNRCPTEPRVTLVSPEDIRLRIREEAEFSSSSSSEDSSSYRFVDASFSLPNSNRSPIDEFESQPRIEGSIFFDHQSIANLNYKVPSKIRNVDMKKIDAVDDESGCYYHGLDHMVPDLKTFRGCVERLGIQRHQKLIFYDSNGIFSSPRAAWLFNIFGHPDVYVLDGGLPRWISEKNPTKVLSLTKRVQQQGRSISSYEIDFEGSEEDFDRSIRSKRVIGFEEVLKNSKLSDKDKRIILLDARSKERFLGNEPEPRPMIKSGKIPNSISLPFKSLLSSTNSYLPLSELDSIFLKTMHENGYGSEVWDRIKSGEREAVVSCGSGLTACVVWLAIWRLSGGRCSVRVYDESWTGFALRTQ
ncbi:Rhodanese-like domain-containing protein [Phakopsora pachyrhizi]|uniref:Rhodanese-like domain-containing protein n=1 Tax=Phakopsora pachyrhizi TaxID=170000 RepID=A0AAV0AWC8_PHAPC|nr:Rhodanese-like domain-containing protein [Phakopsora pachyrhizi]